MNGPSRDPVIFDRRVPMLADMIRLMAVCLVLMPLAGEAVAQTKGTLTPKPLPPLANPNDPNLPAKELFGRRPQPADLKARAIGFYSRGCLAGAQALPRLASTTNASVRHLPTNKPRSERQD